MSVMFHLLCYMNRYQNGVVCIAHEDSWETNCFVFRLVKCGDGLVIYIRGLEHHLLHQVAVGLLHTGVRHRFIRVSHRIHDVSVLALPVAAAPAEKHREDRQRGVLTRLMRTDVMQHLLLPTLSSRDHFILLTVAPPLVARAPPPGDVIAAAEHKHIRVILKQGVLIIKQNAACLIISVCQVSVVMSDSESVNMDRTDAFSIQFDISETVMIQG